MNWRLLLFLCALWAGARSQGAQPVTGSADFFARLAAAAADRARHTVRYDGAYVTLSYPGGDVPTGTGVCTDEVIRAYRGVGIDLQKEVHEDMRANFPAYPRRWGLRSPDSNIDHRRVPNLQTFFSRKGSALPISRDPGKYRPGDLITWDLGGGVPHIGIAVDQRTDDGRPLILHNVGQGPKIEDVLFRWKITGHYRYGR